MAPATRWAAISVLMVLSGCASSGPKTVPMEETVVRKEGWTEKGDASWYGKPYHGRKTASGEVYDMYEMTAAHRSLPFGTIVRVTRRDTGAKVEVRINDRGPFIKGRIIDLSLAAARVIGLDRDGVAPVKLKVVGTADRNPKKPRNSKPPPPEPSGDRPCFWVQVGAFSSADNADRAVDRLRRDGEKALAIESPGGLTRVRVGPFEKEKNAEKAKRRLLERWPSAQVVACGG